MKKLTKKKKGKVLAEDVESIEQIESQFDSKLSYLYNKYFNQTLETENITDPIRKSIKKKLVSLLGVLLIFITFSCSSDEIQTEEVKQDCTCGTIIKADYFNAAGIYFTVFEVKNNCTGVVKQIKKNGEYKVNQTYCGY